MRALFLALVLAGCATASGTATTSSRASIQAPQLIGSNWTLAGQVQRPPTLSFTDERANGFGGCNRWFGQWVTTHTELRFQSVGATRMACDAPAMDVERAFFATLTNTRTGEISNGQLVLRNEAGSEIARFNRTPTGS